MGRTTLEVRLEVGQEVGGGEHYCSGGQRGDLRRRLCCTGQLRGRGAGQRTKMNIRVARQLVHRIMIYQP